MTGQESGDTMIRRDRELLADLSAVNTWLGEAVVDLLARQDGGELPPDGLRVLGEHLHRLGMRLQHRAAQLDSRLAAPTLGEGALGELGQQGSGGAVSHAAGPYAGAVGEVVGDPQREPPG